MKLYSPATVKAIINKYKFHFQKSLGQNFLIDGNIVNKIVDAADINCQDAVLEIGAGIGTLTRALSEKAGKVVVIEIDKNLLPILKETLDGCNNIKIVLGNALKLNFDDIMLSGTQGDFGLGAKSYKVVANLPYYITTPIIMHALESHFNIRSMVVMVQKEVAQRMTAVPGTKDYGALTLGINYYSEPKSLIKVPNKVFIPQPEVESMVVKLDRRVTPPAIVDDEKIFFEVVRAAFGQRRKTLANTLLKLDTDLNKEEIIKILHNLEVDPSRRGETLSFSEFAKIANTVFALNKNKQI